MKRHPHPLNRDLLIEAEMKGTGRDVHLRAGLIGKYRTKVHVYNRDLTTASDERLIELKKEINDYERRIQIFVNTGEIKHD